MFEVLSPLKFDVGDREPRKSLSTKLFCRNGFVVVIQVSTEFCLNPGARARCSDSGFRVDRLLSLLKYLLLYRLKKIRLD